MNKTDFEYDHDQFQRALVMAAGGYKRAKESLLENIDHWQRLGSELLMGNLSLAIHEPGELITGEILGRKFRIHVAPFVEKQNGYALVVVSTPGLSGGELNECCRFLIAANGSVLSCGKEELLAWDDHVQSYRLLIAITHRVLSSPMQV